MKKWIELSKEVSYALRHAPWEYGLEMDEQGWVQVEQLIAALRLTTKWENVTEDDLREMMAQADKKRFQLKEGKIRAFYGHSISKKIIKEEKMPPDILYHGTARRFLEGIKQEGLLPQNRQYVHLSQDMETAEKVGKRHDAKPCILSIDAKRAWEDGINFYLGNEKVWLADEIPNKYILDR